MTSPAGMIICLDDVELGNLVGPVEVLIQEGFDLFSLSAKTPNLAEVVGVFEARATFGAHQIYSSEDVHLAADAGCTFLLAGINDEAIAHAARERGIDVWLPGMTPTELRAILHTDVAGAVVFPADVLGHGIATHLKDQGLIERLIPQGALGAFSAGEWLKAGAQAVCVDETLLGDALRGGDLGQLRDRCSAFVTIRNRHRRRKR